MEEKMKQVLYKWLEIDLVNIAKKMGLSDKSCDVNLELRKYVIIRICPQLYFSDTLFS